MTAGAARGELADAFEDVFSRRWESILADDGAHVDVVAFDDLAQVAASALEYVGTAGSISAGVHLFTIGDTPVPAAGVELAPPRRDLPARPPAHTNGDNVPAEVVPGPESVLGVDADPGPAPTTVTATPPTAAASLETILDLVIANPRPLWNGWRQGIVRLHRVARLADLDADILADVAANAHEFAHHVARRGPVPAASTPKKET